MELNQVLNFIIGPALTAFVLTQIVLSFDRRRRRRAHWAALDIEIDICEHFARTYLKDVVAAPLYRLPTRAITTSFAALLADGVVSQSEVKDLELFAERVQEINRGLDLATAARGRGDNQLLEEATRVDLKCIHLLEEHEIGGERSDAYVKRARRAVKPHVKKRKK